MTDVEERPPNPTPRAANRWLPSLAFGGVLVGVTALVCRYVFLPLDAPGSLVQGLLVGAPIGLVVVGIQQWRAAARQGSARPTALGALLGVVAAGAVVALYARFAPGSPYSDVALAERRLPGLTELPLEQAVAELLRATCPS